MVQVVVGETGVKESQGKAGEEVGADEVYLEEGFGVGEEGGTRGHGGGEWEILNDQKETVGMKSGAPHED